MFLQTLASRREALAQLSPELQTEARQALVACGQSLGLALTLGVQLSLEFSPPVSFGLKFAGSYQGELSRCGSEEGMVQHWQENIQMVFLDPTLRVVRVQKGSIVLLCESRAPPITIAQRAVQLVHGHKKLSLPPLEGFSLGLNLDSQSRIEWTSPSKLKEQLMISAPLPAFAKDSGSHQFVGQLNHPPQLQGSVDKQDQLIPLTDDEYLAIAKEYGY